MDVMENFNTSYVIFYRAVFPLLRHNPEISIHPMLFFIVSGTPGLRFAWENFNTSYVIFYPRLVCWSRSHMAISIHPMLFFIRFDIIDGLPYIDFNTSYVIFYRKRSSGLTDR